MLHHLTRIYKKNHVLMGKDPLPTLEQVCKLTRLDDETLALFIRLNINVNDLLNFNQNDIEKLHNEKKLKYGPMMRILYWKQAYNYLHNIPEFTTKEKPDQNLPDDDLAETSNQDSSESSSDDDYDDDDNSSDNGDAYDLAYSGHHWCCGIKRKREDQSISVEDELKAINIITNDTHTESDVLFFCRLNRIGGMRFANEDGANGDIQFSTTEEKQITFINNSMTWGEDGLTHLLRDTGPVTHINGVSFDVYKTKWFRNL